MATIYTQINQQNDLQIIFLINRNIYFLIIHWYFRSLYLKWIFAQSWAFLHEDFSNETYGLSWMFFQNMQLPELICFCKLINHVQVSKFIFICLYSSMALGIHVTKRRKKRKCTLNMHPIECIFVMKSLQKLVHACWNVHLGVFFCKLFTYHLTLKI